MISLISLHFFSSVGTGLVGAPACGDVMKLQFEVDENGTIIDAKFKTFGCGSAIASSSVATEWLKGRKVDDCLSIKVSLYSRSSLTLFSLFSSHFYFFRILILLHILNFHLLNYIVVCLLKMQLNLLLKILKRKIQLNYFFNERFYFNLNFFIVFK